MDQLPPIHSPIRHPAHNLGMCPDWESNPLPFGGWNNAPSYWATRPVHQLFLNTPYFEQFFQQICFDTVIKIVGELIKTTTFHKFINNISAINMFHAAVLDLLWIRVKYLFCSHFYIKKLYIYDPPKWNLFVTMCVFIFTCLNFSHLQSALHLMRYTYRDFFTA